MSDTTTDSVETPAAPKKSGAKSGGLGGKVLAELQEIAADLNISGASGMRKGELIDAIKAARGDAAPAKAPTKAAKDDSAAESTAESAQESADEAAVLETEDEHRQQISADFALRCGHPGARHTRVCKALLQQPLDAIELESRNILEAPVVLDQRRDRLRVRRRRCADIDGVRHVVVIAGEAGHWSAVSALISSRRRAARS